MKEVRVLQKDLMFTLNTDEITSIRREVMSLQSQSLKINQQIEDLMQKLTDNKVMRHVKVIEETDIDAGTITQFYNGQLIQQQAIPSSKSKEEVEIPQGQKAKEQDQENSFIDPESYLLEPEKVDPDFEEEEDLDIFAAPV